MKHPFLCAAMLAAGIAAAAHVMPSAALAQQLEAYPRWDVRQGSPDDPDLSRKDRLLEPPLGAPGNTPMRKRGRVDVYGNPNYSTHVPDPTVDFRNDLRQDMRRNPGYREGVDSRYDPRQDSRFNGRSDPRPSNLPPSYGRSPGENVFRGPGNINRY